MSRRREQVRGMSATLAYWDEGVRALGHAQQQARLAATVPRRSYVTAYEHRRPAAPAA